MLCGYYWTTNFGWSARHTYSLTSKSREFTTVAEGSQTSVALCTTSFFWSRCSKRNSIKHLFCYTPEWGWANHPHFFTSLAWKTHRPIATLYSNSSAWLSIGVKSTPETYHFGGYRNRPWRKYVTESEWKVIPRGIYINMYETIEWFRKFWYLSIRHACVQNLMSTAELTGTSCLFVLDLRVMHSQ